MDDGDALLGQVEDGTELGLMLEGTVDGVVDEGALDSVRRLYEDLG